MRTKIFLLKVVFSQQNSFVKRKRIYIKKGLGNSPKLVVMEMKENILTEKSIDFAARIIKLLGYFQMIHLHTKDFML